MPKAPQDHKVKVLDDVQIAPEEIPGWDLLKPFDEIPVWDQIPLVAQFYEAMGEAEEAAKIKFEETNAKRVEKGLKPLTPTVQKDDKGKVIKDDNGDPVYVYEKDFDPRMIGDLAKAVMEYAVDKEELTKFFSGKGAIERTAQLCMAWVGQMGES